MDAQKNNERKVQNDQKPSSSNQIILKEAMVTQGSLTNQVFVPISIQPDTQEYQTVILNENFLLIENEKPAAEKQYSTIHFQNTNEFLQSQSNQNDDLLQELAEARSHAIQLHLTKAADHLGNNKADINDRDLRTYSRFKRYQELEASRLSSEVNLTSQCNITSHQSDSFNLSSEPGLTSVTYIVPSSECLTNTIYNVTSSEGLVRNTYNLSAAPGFSSDRYNVTMPEVRLQSEPYLASSQILTSDTYNISSSPVLPSDTYIVTPESFTSGTCSVQTQGLLSDTYDVHTSQGLISDTYNIPSSQYAPTEAYNPQNPQAYALEQPFNQFLQFNPEFQIIEEPAVIATKDTSGVTFSQVIKYVSSHEESEVLSRNDHFVSNCLQKPHEFSKSVESPVKFEITVENKGSTQEENFKVNIPQNTGVAHSSHQSDVGVAIQENCSVTEFNKDNDNAEVLSEDNSQQSSSEITEGVVEKNVIQNVVTAKEPQKHAHPVQNEISEKVAQVNTSEASTDEIKNSPETPLSFGETAAKNSDIQQPLEKQYVTQELKEDEQVEPLLEECHYLAEEVTYENGEIINEEGLPIQEIEGKLYRIRLICQCTEHELQSLESSENLVEEELGHIEPYGQQQIEHATDQFVAKNISTQSNNVEENASQIPVIDTAILPQHNLVPFMEKQNIAEEIDTQTLKNSNEVALLTENQVVEKIFARTYLQQVIEDHSVIKETDTLSTEMSQEEKVYQENKIIEDEIAVQVQGIEVKEKELVQHSELEIYEQVDSSFNVSSRTEEIPPEGVHQIQDGPYHQQSPASCGTEEIDAQNEELIYAQLQPVPGIEYVSNINSSIGDYFVGEQIIATEVATIPEVGSEEVTIFHISEEMPDAEIDTSEVSLKNVNTQQILEEHQVVTPKYQKMDGASQSLNAMAVDDFAMQSDNDVQNSSGITDISSRAPEVENIQEVGGEKVSVSKEMSDSEINKPEVSLESVNTLLILEEHRVVTPKNQKRYDASQYLNATSVNDCATQTDKVQNISETTDGTSRAPQGGMLEEKSPTKRKPIFSSSCGQEAVFIEKREENEVTEVSQIKATKRKSRGRPRKVPVAVENKFDDTSEQSRLQQDPSSKKEKPLKRRSLKSSDLSENQSETGEEINNQIVVGEIETTDKMITNEGLGDIVAKDLPEVNIGKSRGRPPKKKRVLNYIKIHEIEASNKSSNDNAKIDSDDDRKVCMERLQQDASSKKEKPVKRRSLKSSDLSENQSEKGEEINNQVVVGEIETTDKMINNEVLGYIVAKYLPEVNIRKSRGRPPQKKRVLNYIKSHEIEVLNKSSNSNAKIDSDEDRIVGIECLQKDASSKKEKPVKKRSLKSSDLTENQSDMGEDINNQVVGEIERTDKIVNNEGLGDIVVKYLPEVNIRKSRGRPPKKKRVWNYIKNHEIEASNKSSNDSEKIDSDEDRIVCMERLQKDAISKKEKPVKSSDLSENQSGTGEEINNQVVGEIETTDKMVNNEGLGDIVARYLPEVNIRKSRGRPPKKKRVLNYIKNHEIEVLNKSSNDNAKIDSGENRIVCMDDNLYRPNKLLKRKPKKADTNIAQVSSVSRSSVKKTSNLHIQIPKKKEGIERKDHGNRKQIDASKKPAQQTINYGEDTSDDEVIINKKPSAPPVLTGKRSALPQIRVNPEAFKGAILKRIKQEHSTESAIIAQKIVNIKKEPLDNSGTSLPGDMLKSWLLQEVTKPKTLRLRSGIKTTALPEEQLQQEDDDQNLAMNTIVEITAEDIGDAENCHNFDLQTTDAASRNAKGYNKGVTKRGRKRKIDETNTTECVKKKRKFNKETSLSQEIEKLLDETAVKEQELGRTYFTVEQQLKTRSGLEKTFKKPKRDQSETTPKDSDITTTETVKPTPQKRSYKAKKSITKIQIKKKSNTAATSENKNIKMIIKAEIDKDMPSEQDEIIDKVVPSEQGEIIQTPSASMDEGGVKNGITELDEDSDTDSRKEWLPADYAEYKHKFSMNKIRKPTVFKCKVCLKLEPSYYMLLKHRKEHVKDRPYKCTQCKDDFADVDEFQAHIRLHRGKQPYQCRKCDSGFMTKEEYDSHQPIHILRKETPKPKRFRCEVCSKQFSKLCDMDRHLRVHTGEKPAACHICNKRFQQTHNLSKHLLTHLALKPFNCEICGKKFGRIDILNRHLLTHSIEKPFKCNMCSKGFIRSSQYDVHMKTLHPDEIMRGVEES